MTEEERERVKQIERWRLNYISANRDAYADLSRAFYEIDFLLSLLDNQAATTLHVFVKAKDDDRCLTCGNLKLWQYHVDEEVIATRMRDACVARLDQIADEWDQNALRRGAAFSDKANIARKLATELQSLTLDQAEQEKG